MVRVPLNLPRRHVRPVLRGSRADRMHRGRICRRVPSLKFRHRHPLWMILAHCRPAHLSLSPDQGEKGRGHEVRYVWAEEPSLAMDPSPQTYLREKGQQEQVAESLHGVQKQETEKNWYPWPTSAKAMSNSLASPRATTQLAPKSGMWRIDSFAFHHQQHWIRSCASEATSRSVCLGCNLILLTCYETIWTCDETCFLKVCTDLDGPHLL